MKIFLTYQYIALVISRVTQFKQFCCLSCVTSEILCDISPILSSYSWATSQSNHVKYNINRAFFINIHGKGILKRISS